MFDKDGYLTQKVTIRGLTFMPGELIPANILEAYLVEQENKERLAKYFGPGPASESAESKDAKAKTDAQTVSEAAASPQKPPAERTIDETFLWIVQQRIQDKLDPQFRSTPTASQVFVAFCRERLNRAEMARKNVNWSESTIKLRIKDLREFLKREFNGLTLEAFFVDRSLFTAAEKQLKDYRAKNISPLSVGELHGDEDE